MSEDRDKPGFGDTYKRGLYTSVRDNAAAFGYSVTIAASFGILSTLEGTPGFARSFPFALAAVAGFTLVEAIATGGFRHGLQEEPVRVRALGTSFSFFSVGTALGIDFLVGRLTGGVLAWVLGAFCATVVYVFVLALEISVAEKLQPGGRETTGGER